jgi:hypothetical protein
MALTCVKETEVWVYNYVASSLSERRLTLIHIKARDCTKPINVRETQTVELRPSEFTRRAASDMYTVGLGRFVFLSYSLSRR